MPSHGQTPMERFQAETFLDGPWNAIGEVAVPANTRSVEKAASQHISNVSSARATQGSSSVVAEGAAKGA